MNDLMKSSSSIPPALSLDTRKSQQSPLIYALSFTQKKHKHTSNSIHRHKGTLKPVRAACVSNGLPGSNEHVNHNSLGAGGSVSHTSYTSNS